MRDEGHFTKKHRVIGRGKDHKNELTRRLIGEISGGERLDLEGGA